MVLIGACSSSSKSTSSGSGPSVSEATSAGGASATTSTSKAAAATPKTSKALHLSAPITLPNGQPGKLSVIAVGKATQNSSSVPVVVRNNTADTVYNVAASGTARKSGALVASGESQGFAPAVVHPGEWAMGYVYFGTNDAVIQGATFEVTATADTSPSSIFPEVDLTIAEANKTQGQFGATIVGIVRNDTSSIIDTPIEVWLGCFEGSTPTAVRSDFTNGDNPLSPKATASFSIDVPDTTPCTTYALGSTGRTK
jgi:hypothetical protein